MAATAVTLNDLESHSPVAGFFKCNPSNICAAFYTISTDNMLAGPSALEELLVRSLARDAYTNHRAIAMMFVRLSVRVSA